MRRLRAGSREKTARMSSHCCSLGIHGSLTSRGTSPRPPIPGAWRAPIAATADRVASRGAFFDQEVVEQARPERGAAGAWRWRACARVERQRVRAVATRAARQLPDEGCDLRPTGSERVDAVALAELRYSASPRAYASIVRGDRPRSAHIRSHSAARSFRPRTGHLSSSAIGKAQSTSFSVRGMRRDLFNPAA